MTETGRARLKVHDLGAEGLLLIHEVEQPSYLLLWDIPTIDHTYCAIAAGGALQSGLVASNALLMLAPRSCQTVLSQGSESRPVVRIDVTSASTISGAFRGGHC